MLKSIRSRKMPATATTPSILPQRSTAVSMSRCPASIFEMSSATATASPPPAAISATTLSATSLEGSSPAIDTPIVGDEDLGALGRRRQGHGPTDPAAAAGDRDHLALQEPCHPALLHLLVEIGTRPTAGAAPSVLARLTRS